MLENSYVFEVKVL